MVQQRQGVVNLCTGPLEGSTSDPRVCRTGVPGANAAGPGFVPDPELVVQLREHGLQWRLGWLGSMFPTEFHAMVPQYFRQCGVAGLCTAGLLDWESTLWPGCLVCKKSSRLGFFGHQSLVREFSVILSKEQCVDDCHLTVCCLKADMHEASQLVDGCTVAYVMGFLFEVPARGWCPSGDAAAAFVDMLGNAAKVLAEHGPFLAMGDAGPWTGSVAAALAAGHPHACRVCDGPISAMDEGNNGLWIVGSHGKVTGPRRLCDDHEDWVVATSWLTGLRVSHNDLEEIHGEAILAGQPTLFVGRAPRMRAWHKSRTAASHSWSR